MDAAENNVARNQRLAWYVANDTGASEEVTLALFEAWFAESQFRNYANKIVPSSLAIPHDAVGEDHDSLGVLQQRVKTNGGSRDGETFIGQWTPTTQ
jgi:hypothetical protein